METISRVPRWWYSLAFYSENSWQEKVSIYYNTTHLIQKEFDRIRFNSQSIGVIVRMIIFSLLFSNEHCSRSICTRGNVYELFFPLISTRIPTIGLLCDKKDVSLREQYQFGNRCDDSNEKRRWPMCLCRARLSKFLTPLRASLFILIKAFVTLNLLVLVVSNDRLSIEAEQSWPSNEIFPKTMRLKQRFCSNSYYFAINFFCVDLAMKMSLFIR